MTSPIDISVPLRDDMPTYPGNPPFEHRFARTLEEGAHSTLSVITMGTHSGTHVDAPGHFIQGRDMLDEVGLDPLVGPCRVLELDAESAVAVEDLEPHAVQDGERILLKTRNSDELWDLDEFQPDFVHLSTEAAEYLARKRIVCLGVDYLSVGGHRSNGAEVHEALLGAGILCIEGLDLSGAEPGEYRLVCLPLSIQGAEAAPARAILLPL